MFSTLNVMKRTSTVVKSLKLKLIKEVFVSFKIILHSLASPKDNLIMLLILETECQDTSVIQEWRLSKKLTMNLILDRKEAHLDEGKLLKEWIEKHKIMKQEILKLFVIFIKIFLHPTKSRVRTKNMSDSTEAVQVLNSKIQKICYSQYLCNKTTWKERRPM